VRSLRRAHVEYERSAQMRLYAWNTLGIGAVHRCARDLALFDTILVSNPLSRLILCCVHRLHFYIGSFHTIFCIEFEKFGKKENLTSNLNQTGHTFGIGPVPHCARDLAFFATLF
jgi:hypothetical protein